MNTVVFSRERDDWETPLDLYGSLLPEFDFQMDCAATAENALCREWLGPGSPRGEDALAVDWSPCNWLNPPYSKVAKFIAKAAEQRLRGCTTVAFVVPRTNTRWWHAHVWDVDRHTWRQGVEGRLLPGRYVFTIGGEPNRDKRGKPVPAPFPSSLIIFRGEVAS